MLNEMISINVLKYVLLSDPDPGTGRVHKVVLSVQEVLRNAIDCVDIKFSCLNLDVYHDERTTKFLEVVNFSVKEVTKPWKSAEVKVDTLKSDWDPSSHMTLHSMVKYYSRILPAKKTSPKPIMSPEISEKPGKELLSWKLERKLKNVIQTSITCNSFILNAKTLDPFLCKSIEDSITNCFQLTSVDILLSASGMSLKCHEFNVYCDVQKILANKFNSKITEDALFTNNETCENSQVRDASPKKHPNHVNPIFAFNEFYVRYCCISSAPSSDREKFSLFSKNHCVLLEVNSFKFQLPNNYVFHQNFSQFTLARKWLRSLYVGTPSSESSISSPVSKKLQNDSSKPKSTFVWPDFNFFLGNFTFAIEDSPFEKRLGENYRLLLDEKLQQMERLELFERRWNQLEMESGGNPELCSIERYSQMMDQLMQLNSSLYAQRWKESRSIFSQHVNLFVISIDNWQINCFADEEMTGRENIVNNINELDGKTTVPEGLQFSSQACRLINVGFDLFKVTLRDYPDAMYEIENCTLNGKLVIVIPRAENAALSFVDYSLGPHFEAARLKRNPGNQKWFFNLSKNCDKVVFNWSQNRDPVWNEVNHGFNMINKPSTDPSPPLPFWDKARHRTHGNLHCFYKSLEVTCLCTLDPYKQSEKLRILWHNVHYDWIPNNMNLGGDLKVVVQTSGKNPLTLMQAPRTRMSWNFTYNCLGNPYAHHQAVYSPQNIHSEDYDTYSKFRSNSFDVIFSISIKPTMSVLNPADVSANIINDETLLHRDLPGDSVKIEMYSSTFNWCHRFIKLASTTSRPIRRGKLYKNVRTKKKAALMRHFRDFVTKCEIPTLTYSYRVSQKKDLGVTIYFSSDSRLKSEHTLHMETRDGPLVRRPLTKWITRSLIFDLNSVFIYVISDNTEAEEECSLIDSYIKEKSNKEMPRKLHFMSVQSLSYHRTESQPLGTLIRTASTEDESGNNEYILTPVHSLSAAGVHATWSRRNRRIIMRLYDQYQFSKSLRQNLSSDALKPIVVVSNEQVKPKPDRRMSMAVSAYQQKRMSLGNSVDDSESSEDLNTSSQLNTTSSSQGQKVNNPFCDPLYELLVKDIDSKRFFGFNEEKYIEEDEEDVMNLEDVTQLHLKVTISDLQLKLLGFDTPGLVIVTASEALMNKYQHESLWYEEKLYSKHSLQVSLNDMQYFATLSYNDLVACEENNETVAWLPASVVNVESLNLSKSMEEQSFHEDVYTEAIGALVSSCGSYRLQRIISKCCCSVDLLNFRALSETDNVPIYNVPSKKQMSKKAPVSLFRLHHNDLCICTNSFQYSLVLDIVNNLILYQEKSRKISNENLKILRLSMQVNEYADLKSSIINLQRNLREGNFILRQLKQEKVVLENKLKTMPNPNVALTEAAKSASSLTLNWHALSDMLSTQEQKVQVCKEELEAGAQRLKLALTCYKELQLRSKIQLPNSDEMPAAANKKEIVFDKAKWSLTEVDGQIAFSDVCLTNFHYLKIAHNDDSMDHKVILEDAEVKNLINNDHFVDILQTHEKDRVNAKSKMGGSASDVGSVSSNPDDEVSVDSNRGMVLVVQMREKPAVGGIQIRELLDIKIAPLNIHLTEAFWKTMKQFLFPVESKKKQEEEELYQMTLLTTALTADRSSKLTLANNTSSSYSLSAAFANKKKRKAKKESKGHDFEKRYIGNGPDSIDLAFERAARNCMFVMIRIREVPIHVSYRGDKKKNIEDIHNMHIVLPRVEIHNMTMTWRDLLNNIRSEVTKTIVKGWMQEKLRLGAYRNKLLTDEDQAALMIDKEKLRKLNEQHLSKQK